MTSENKLVPTGEVVTWVTMKELCRVSGCTADWVVDLVEEGILEPVGPDRSAWRFESSSLTVVRRVQRLQIDLDVNLAGIAVVLALVEENAQLKRRLAQLEQDAALPIWQTGPGRET
jgi:chaperone modulatory protein CbpM